MFIKYYVKIINNILIIIIIINIITHIHKNETNFEYVNGKRIN